MGRLPRRRPRRRRRGSRSAPAASESGPGAEYADVGKLIQMEEGDVQSLAAAHGEAGNGAVGPVGQDPVVRLRIRHDVGKEVLRKLVEDGRLRAAAASRRSGASASTWGSGGVPGGHYDHHRFDLLRCDQVVQYETGAAFGCPHFVTVAGPMQEI